MGGVECSCELGRAASLADGTTCQSKRETDTITAMAELKRGTRQSPDCREVRDRVSEPSRNPRDRPNKTRARRSASLLHPLKLDAAPKPNQRSSLAASGPTQIRDDVPVAMVEVGADVVHDARLKVAHLSTHGTKFISQNLHIRATIMRRANGRPVAHAVEQVRLPEVRAPIHLIWWLSFGC